VIDPTAIPRWSAEHSRHRRWDRPPVIVPTATWRLAAQH